MMQLIAVLGLAIILFTGIDSVSAEEKQGYRYLVTDKNLLMQASLATLQEIGFYIENVDATKWTLNAARYLEHPDPRVELSLSLEQADNEVVMQAELLVDGKTVPFHHIAYHNFFLDVEQKVSEISRR